MTGEAEHPSDKGGRRNLLETVVMWDAANLNEAGQVEIEGTIIPTANGRDILALIESGVPVGISQRAYGNSKTSKRAGASVEEITELTITGYDMVSEPSDPNGRILESTEEIEHIMTEQEIRELLKDNPAILKVCGRNRQTKPASRLQRAWASSRVTLIRPSPRLSRPKTN